MIRKAAQVFQTGLLFQAETFRAHQEYQSKRGILSRVGLPLLQAEAQLFFHIHTDSSQISRGSHNGGPIH